MTSGRWAAGLLLVSAALLAYELLLMRLLALAYWGHFAGMVISIAMLGIACSGLFLFFMREHVNPRAQSYFAVSAGLFGITAPLAFLASQQLPFTPFLLTWSPREYGLLAARSLLFFIPFFCGGVAIGTPFVARMLPMGRLYFWNMLGSGLPALPLLAAMNFTHPMRLLSGVTVLAIGATVAATCDGRRLERSGTRNGGRMSALGRGRPVAALVWAILGVATIVAVALTPFRYSEYKDLPKTLQLPDAKLLWERYGWDGVVQVVESPHTRYLPGLSLNFMGTLPAAKLVFTDAGAMTLAFDPEQGLGAPDFLRMTPEAFPFSLTTKPSVLHFYGGTADMLRLHLFASADSRVVDDNSMRAETLKILLRSTELNPLLESDDARQRLERETTARRLIGVSLLGTHGTATAGAASLDPSFLLTREGCSRLLDRLTADGYAVFSTWVENPPRSGVRLAALLVEALRPRVGDPAAHLLALRSYSTLSIFVARDPFRPEQIEALKTFCDDNSFDLVWYNGIEPAETNRFNILPDEPYSAAFAALLGPNRQKFIDESPFSLTAPTDNRPFFNHYFRWAAVPQWVQTMGMSWLPFVEWGYLLHVATLVVVTLLGVVLLLVPAGLTRARPSLRHAALFFSLGVAYMFVQIWAIYKLTQFVAHPLLASATVLSVMLAASGAGAAFMQSATRGRFVLLGCVLLASIAAFPFLLRFLYAQPIALRAIVAAVWLIVPAFFMGFPFPTALARLRQPAEVPWALALNGFGSVVGSLLATLVAVHFGFLVLALAAVALYAVVGLLSGALASRGT